MAQQNALNRHGLRGLAQSIILILGLISCVCTASPDALPTVPRVLPVGQLPNDHRLRPPKDLNGYFPFVPADSPAQWGSRAAQLRRQLAVALGLWPMPPKTPLNPVIHGKIDQPDYTIEKVYFESIPGFYVTGNLYRPKGRTGRLPAVLSPHGHWKNGRFVETSTADLKKEIESGGERFENGGRSPLQARCVQLARMGCVVFHYDMIGYADSVQISESLAHGFAKQRPEMNSTEAWGLFSPQAESHLQSVMGLQTWNSIRALDFLETLPDVDSKRIGVTGASGGGTQTFILCALDERPLVSFPAVMVSTAMQGGCTCENACLLRVDTGNVEIAALFAPKPLGLTAANDWTREMQTKGFPELQKHFSMMGAPRNVMLEALLHFGHNYNFPSRAAMYSWMKQYLGLNEADAAERDYNFLTASELSVWDIQHPKPPGGPDFERKLLQWITDRDQKLLTSFQESPSEFKKVYGGAWDVIIGRNLSSAGSVTSTCGEEVDRGAYSEKPVLLRNTTHDEEVPSIILQPRKWKHRAVIWADPAGKSGLYLTTSEGQLTLKDSVRKLLRAGVMVIGIDLCFQGEFLRDSGQADRNRKVENPRESAAYTFGYNHALFAQRVHDLLTAIQYARKQVPGLRQLDLVGLNGAGHWAAAARAQAEDAVFCAAVDTAGFRFGKVTDIYDPNFLPGGAKYGDVPGLLALAAPGKLWLAGEPATPELAARMYPAKSERKRFETSKVPAVEIESAAAKWLIAQKP